MLTKGAWVVAALLALAQRPDQPPPVPAEQRPVFRGGTALVRVDAYPTREGRVLEGLTADDFEVYEDGKLQPLAAADFIPFDRLPDDDRGTLLSPREGLELAADSRYRVFVIVIERQAFDRELWRETRAALLKFLETEVTPRDLLALITTDQPWTSVFVGRRLSEIQREIDSPEWIRPVLSEQSAVLLECGADGYQARIRADETYALLEGVIRMLGQVREDRTSIVYVANGLNRQPPDRRLAERRPMSMPAGPGLVNGRIQRVPRASDMHDQFCKAELRRLAETDFSHRFQDLITLARASNVAFYPIAVPLLVPALPIPRGMPLPPGTPMQRVRVDGGLGNLASATDGLMIRGEEDLTRGLQRMVQDATAHYLLGYYSTNQKADGKLRRIQVRLKKTGAVIRARPFYRAPDKKEMKTLTMAKAAPLGPPPHIVAALDALSRSRPSSQFYTYSALQGTTLTVVIEVPPAAVDAGRWSDGGAVEVIADAANGDTAGMGRGRLMPNGRALLKVPLDAGRSPSNVLVRLRAEGESLVERTALSGERTRLVGDPLGYRSGSRGLAIPVALFEFSRDEKLRLDWPLFAQVEGVELRLLDRKGLPLKHKVSAAMQQTAEGAHAVADLSFTALGRGDYVVELTAAGGGSTERKVLALRVK